jgi:hypothetical protein
VSKLVAPELPGPWCPPTPRLESLSVEGDEEHDAIEVERLAPGPDRAPEGLREEANRLARLLGLQTDFELLVEPSPEPRRGFCRGRVWMRGGQPLKIWLSPCPNGDEAEVLATLIHELAHPVSGSGHDPAFRRALLRGAGLGWGSASFVSASAKAPTPELDRWIASGIRAALKGAEAPAPKTCDSGDTARVVTRIRKLHALAAAQVGQPEAIAATARANELITSYGLGGYQVEIEAGIDEQMVDRWVALAPRKVWQRQLAHGLARYFGVFSLAMARKARMHIFGRHADVVATAWLLEVCIEKIERACEAHIQAWKRLRPRSSGEGRSERTAFCDNAVWAFRRKLEGLASLEPQGSEALAAAEDFAWIEHDKRGQRWGSGRGKRVRHHAAGQALGRSLEVVRGVHGKTVKRLR